MSQSHHYASGNFTVSSKHDESSQPVNYSSLQMPAISHCHEGVRWRQMTFLFCQHLWRWKLALIKMNNNSLWNGGGEAANIPQGSLQSHWLERMWLGHGNARNSSAVREYGGKKGPRIFKIHWRRAEIAEFRQQLFIPVEQDWWIRWQL